MEKLHCRVYFEENKHGVESSIVLNVVDIKRLKDDGSEYLITYKDKGKLWDIIFKKIKAIVLGQSYEDLLKDPFKREGD